MTLTWNGKQRFDYEFGSVAEAIRRNMAASDHVMYPCEPRLIYPMCNAFAISGLVMHDRLHGSSMTGELVERLRESVVVNNYLRHDGRFVSCLGPLRFSLPPAVGNDAIVSYWFHATMPEVSERTWGVISEQFLKIADDDVKLRTELFDGLDPGNYAGGDSMTRATVIATANEMGDIPAEWRTGPLLAQAA